MPNNNPPVEVIQDARARKLLDLIQAESDGMVSHAIVGYEEAIRAMLAFQSEARAGEGEVVCPQIEMGHGLVDVGQIHWQGRKGIVLHPRENFIPIGEEGDLKGDYWPVTSDVVIWIDSPGGADTIISELAPLATPSHPLPDREAIARELDPKEWGKYDQARACPSVTHAATSGIGPSLVRADHFLGILRRLSLTPSPGGEGVTTAADNELREGECTCAEIHGEDPNCALHGEKTQWGIENAECWNCGVLINKPTP